MMGRCVITNRNRNYGRIPMNRTLQCGKQKLELRYNIDSSVLQNLKLQGFAMKLEPHTQNIFLLRIDAISV
jgi:hypothetical protein